MPRARLVVLALESMIALPATHTLFWVLLMLLASASALVVTTLTQIQAHVLDATMDVLRVADRQKVTV
jgi:hypothetical protein